MTVCLSDIPTNLGDVAVCEGNVMKINNMQRCGDIRLYFRNDTLARTLRYGDTLLLHGYPDILRRSIYLTSDHYIVIARDSTSLRAHSEALRRRLLQRMQDGPLRDCSVAEALALGWKGGIDRDTRAHYRNAGLAHMLAVSGLHVGLLAAMVADGVTGKQHHSNTELIAQGIANIVTPIFGGIPSTGALARTMASINNVCDLLSRFLYYKYLIGKMKILCNKLPIPSITPSPLITCLWINMSIIL